MKQAFVALGSNLANPISQVESAFSALEKLPNTVVVKKSSLYKTTPIGYEVEQLKQIPDFINAVAELETDLAPLELLDALLAIENQAGRERPFHNAPRVLDCDLLLYENVSMESAKLILPHPRMHQRGFVLLPLFEIAAQLSIPNHGKIATLIQEQQFTGIAKL
jgi:2-amino-4-hydroxy-6-hydroxymethyldihydropteridine diphosphokinase